MTETAETHVHDVDHGEARPPRTGWGRLVAPGWLRALWMAPAFGALGLGIVLFVRWIAGWDPLWDMQPIVVVAGTVAFPLGYLAGIGCFDCKKWLHAGMMAELSPIREREDELKRRPDEVRDILREGARASRADAAATVAIVEEKLGLPGAL